MEGYEVDMCVYYFIEPGIMLEGVKVQNVAPNEFAIRNYDWKTQSKQFLPFMSTTSKLDQDEECFEVHRGCMDDKYVLIYEEFHLVLDQKQELYMFQE